MSLSKAELDFFGILQSDTPLDKEAVELEPETRALLGVEETPDELDELERSAARTDSGAAGPTAAPEPAAPNPPPPPAPPAEPLRAPAQPPASEPAEAAPRVGVPPAVTVAVDALPAPGERFAIDAFPRPSEEESVEVGSPAVLDEEPAVVDEEDLPAPELVPSRLTHGRIFNARRTHPLQLLEVLQAKYKDRWLDWEAETLWWAIRRDFGPVGEVTRNKIEALRTALTTFLPWDDWDTFENCSLAWNDLTPIFGAFQPMTPSQTAFGVSILQALQPGVEFGHEVKAYIAAVLDEAGFALAPPEWFDGAQELLDRKTWLSDFKDQVAQFWARAQDIDPSAIEWREDNPVDLHIAKLLVVKIYLQEREALRAPPPAPGRSSDAASPPVP